MSRDLVVYRRDLPGGRIVMISIDERDASGVVGRLMLERRADPARRQGGDPPVVAEVRGATRDEVLASLKAVAESEGEVARRLESWLAARRASAAATAGGATGEYVVAPPPVAGQRVRMGDGRWWSVERRHEMTQLSLGPTLDPAAGTRERPLYLFFHGGDGALRRVRVPGDFPERVSDAQLQALWAAADVMR